MSARKVVALDYVEMMEAASKLSFLEFLRHMIIVYAIAVALVVVCERSVAKTPVQSFVILAILFFAIILYVGLTRILPHNNIKFYFAMGSIYALLLPTMTYMHRTRALVTLRADATPHATSDMMKLAYGRWSQALTAGMALAVTIVATVSFNVVSYLTVTFGESFTFFPLLGIILALVIGLAGFLWGVLRSIHHILLEIEEAIARLQIQ